MSMQSVGNLFEDLLRIGAGNVEPAAAGMERFNKFANKVSHYADSADSNDDSGDDAHDSENEAKPDSSAVG